MGGGDIEAKVLCFGWSSRKTMGCSSLGVGIFCLYGNILTGYIECCIYRIADMVVLIKLKWKKNLSCEAAIGDKMHWDRAQEIYKEMVMNYKW